MTGFLLHFRRALGGAMLFLATVNARAVTQTDPGKAVDEFQLSQQENQLSQIPDIRKGITPAVLARLEKQAAEGNARAQAALGLCSQCGFGVPQDYARAAEWYQQAVKGGNPTAENNLGLLYEFGKGVAVDLAKAHALYLQAAQQGLVNGQYNAGVDYAQGIGVAQDWEQARLWYEKAAAQGKPEALTNLGNIYLMGRGVPANVELARKYLQPAADGGNATAEFSLASTYLQQNQFAAALPWLRRSAEGGFPGGQSYWAIALWKGTGGQKKDLAQAIYWARQAVAHLAQGNPKMGPEAHAALAQMLLEQPSEVNNAEAFREATLAAQAGNDEGEYALGECYHQGIGVAKDIKPAIEWFRAAAAQKQAHAASNLGLFYEAGFGVPRDFAEAVKWFKIGAEGGYVVSEYRLGLCYRDGRGVDIDLHEALKWLRKAAPNYADNREFQAALAQLQGQINHIDADAAYKRGASLAQAAQGSGGSMDEALKALNEAVNLGHPFATTALAHMYRAGAGVPKDDERAEALVARIAQSTNPVVLCQIGLTYLPVGGQVLGPKDADRAISFLLHSAQQGYGPALAPLGLCYMAASPEHQDFVSAFVWLSMAAAQGDRNAQMYLERLRPRMTNVQMAEAFKTLNGLQQRGAPPIPSGSTVGLSSNAPAQGASPLPPATR